VFSFIQQFLWRILMSLVTRFWKAILAVVMIGVLSVGLVSCDGSANYKDKIQSESVLQQAINASKAFEAKFFTLRKTKHAAEKLLDAPSLVGYAIVTANDGTPLLSLTTFGSCYNEATQSTNPLMTDRSSSSAVALAQIEPGTGLYPPASSEGTVCVSVAGTVVRAEQPVIWSSSPIRMAKTPSYSLQEDASAGGKVDVTSLKK
jgi:hypothetical protein